MLLCLALWLSGCRGKGADPGDGSTAPSAVTVETVGGSSLIHVGEAHRFSLVQVSAATVAGTLSATGTVNPDVSRELPVLSLANGRVVALHVGLGDTVRKGQLVMEVQSNDVATAFNTYTKAVNDEHLANVTLTRDKLLYEKGAIAQSQLQAAQDGEDDAKADLAAAASQLRVLGVDRSHPGDTVKVYAPASGVVIAQNTTAAGAAGVGFAGANGSLTIADLSHVWVICDVYENDLAKVKLGDAVDIRVNALPGQTFTGRVSDIGAVLDPTLRTAKVRVQVANPAGQLRVGMFVSATLKVATATLQAEVPATAILHLHDRDYVYVPAGSGGFRSVNVQVGKMTPGGMVVVQSGLSVGQQVVANALELQNTADQG